MDYIDILKRWNIWEKDIEIGIIRKEYLKKIFPFMNRKEILVLKGIRRSGKSTIMKQLMYELLKHNILRKQILYLNLEDYSFANNLTLNLFEVVLKEYKEYTQNNEKIFFFIDEIQKIPNWEKFLRTYYDLNENIKFIISGSSASLLSKELSTLLTGRNISFKIMPLSFKEYLDFSHIKELDMYIKYGGFPEVVLENSEDKKIAILNQYFEDIIYRDIIARYNIRNIKQLVELVSYLISASGSKISLNKLSKVFGLSKDTIREYINYILDSFLFFEVPYFSFSAKTKHDVSRLPKLYCTDTGFLTIKKQFGKNEGQFFENAVLIKLLEKYNNISYWSDFNSEVDFVYEKKAINVTSADKIPEREFKGLENFLKIHEDFKIFIISRNIEKTNVIPLKKFLLE